MSTTNHKEIGTPLDTNRNGLDLDVSSIDWDFSNAHHIWVNFNFIFSPVSTMKHLNLVKKVEWNKKIQKCRVERIRFSLKFVVGYFLIYSIILVLLVGLHANFEVPKQFLFFSCRSHFRFREI